MPPEPVFARVSDIEGGTTRRTGVRAMCGIAGYVGISEGWGEPVLRRMAAVQAHRGPDGEGVVGE